MANSIDDDRTGRHLPAPEGSLSSLQAQPSALAEASPAMSWWLLAPHAEERFAAQPLSPESPVLAPVLDRPYLLARVPPCKLA